jgi:hypothetical protein
MTVGRVTTLLRASAHELGQRAEDRLNRRILPQSWADTGARDWACVSGAPTAPRALDTAFVITTYRRPEACTHLVAQLGNAVHATPAVGDHALLVLDDASPENYAASLHERTPGFAGKLDVLRASENHGKHGFWRVIQRAFDWVSARAPKVAVFLQDDLELAPDALTRALAIWAEIPDPRKAVLNLLVTDDDEPDGRWIHLPRVGAPGARHRLTGWFDLAAFLTGPRFWDVMHGEVFPVHPSRWDAWPTMSTRVARQLTLRLWGRASVHQVTETLVFHGAEGSRMNVEARRERPMDNRPR